MISFEHIIRNSVVSLQMTEATGQQVISALLMSAVKHGVLSAQHKDAAIQSVLKREMSASTAMPDGIALPHGRTECVTEIICMIGIHPKGLLFGAPDDLPTHIFVLLLVPLTTGCNHIHFLTKISKCLLEPIVRKTLLSSITSEDVVRIILNYGTKRPF